MKNSFKHLQTLANTCKHLPLKKAFTTLTILAGLILNPTVAAAADKSTVSLSEWQKYSHALPNPFNLDIQPTSFSGEFDVFSATESGGSSLFSGDTTGQALAIGLAVVVGGVVAYNKIKDDDSAAGLTCEQDENHADRRRVFVGEDIFFNNNLLGGDGSEVSLAASSFFPGQFRQRNGGNVYFRQLNGGTTITVLSTTTVSGNNQRGEHPTTGVDVDSQTGNRFAFITIERLDAGELPTDADFIYYSDSDNNYVQETRRICSGEEIDTATEFFLADDYTQSDDYAESRTVFNLREGLLGLLNEKHAIKLDNFYFTASDSELRNYHLEYRTEFYTGDSFNVYSDSGYKRQDSGRTDLYYTKATAIKSITDKAEVYLQLSAGEISSEIYTDSRLQGFALGMFADGIFRHDDSYHFRLSQPFAAAEVKEWRISADAVFGEAADYLRFGISHKLDGKAETKANIFYTKRF